MGAARAYLDYNASAPLLPAAREALVQALPLAGNASSVHREGRAARRLVEEARRAVAALAGARPEHVVFTSGASEAAATLLTPDWRMGRGRARMSRLYVGATEHACVLNGGRFPPDAVAVLGVDRNGVVDLASLREALAAHDRQGGLALVAVQAANNETGVVQPVAEIGALAKEFGAVFLVDAVQAAGRLPLTSAMAYADFLILSSHKIGGPKGSGAIIGASDLLMPVPLIAGGGQEHGFRAGTEDVAAIAGFGAAASVALETAQATGQLRALRDETEAAIRTLVPDAEIFGAGAERLPNTTLFSVPGLKAETMQIAFDLAGVAVSAGSACSSGKVGPSHVVKAMGFGEAAGGIRVSVGWGTSATDIEMFRAALAAIAARRGVARAA